MNLPYEWQIGWRYTRAGRSGRRNGFISFISGMSMLGIALGVASALIYSSYILLGGRYATGSHPISSACVVFLAASVSNGLIVLAQGETVKRLGAWAALLAAPTLITSWYGMNFTGMTELSWEYGYPAVAILCSLVILVCIWFFKKKHWM